MCKSISSDIIIGNLIIEAAVHGFERVTFENLIDFDEKVSTELDKIHYISKFTVNNILEFQDNYPYFVSLGDNDDFEIINNSDNVYFLKKLKRYFRVGVPQAVVMHINEISAKILGI